VKPAGGSRVERLRRERPEARVWLDLVGRATREAGEPVWAAAVPYVDSPTSADRPVLGGAVLRVDRGAAGRWVDELLETAERGAAVRLGARAALDPLLFLDAAVGRSRTGLETLAASAGAEPRALRALADLVAFPLLQACNRRLAASIAPGWTAGYCPVCGAWPALVEARGVERARRLRCGRCGGDWPSEPLRCPFCGTRDHTRLGVLVPASGGERRRVETCRACSGYVKVLATLTAAPPAEVLLEDLASIDLDLAALAEGYLRPEDLGHPLAAMVVEQPGLGRRLPGRAR
jgi:FdhE protein